MSMLSPAGGAKSVTPPTLPSPGSGGAAASSGSAADLASNFANLLRGSIAPQPAAIAPVCETAQASANKSVAKAPVAKTSASNTPSTAPASTPPRESAPAETAAPPAAAPTPAGRARRTDAAADDRGAGEADTAALHKLVMAQVRSEATDAMVPASTSTAALADQAPTDTADAALMLTRAPSEASTLTESDEAGPDGADTATKSANQALPDAAALASMPGALPNAAPTAAVAATPMIDGAEAAATESTTTPTPAPAIAASTMATFIAGAVSPAAQEARSASAAEAREGTEVESLHRGPDAGVERRSEPELPATSIETGGVRPAPPSLPAASAARSAEAAESGKTSRSGAHGSAGELPMTVPTSTIAPPPQFALPRPGASEMRQINLPQPLQAPEFTSALAARVSVLAVEGVQQAQLHLNPAEMGPVSVQINVDGQQAHVAFHAEQAETRQVLEQSLPELAAALRESGLTLSGGGVFQQMHQEARDEHRDARPPAGTSTREFVLDGDLASHGGAAVPARTQRGLLDLYA